MKNATLNRFPLVRGAVDLVAKQIRFDPADKLPLCCMEKCPHYDGKRCNLTGNEPEQTCRTAVAKLIRALMNLDATLFC
jgi:hypothetical protein